MRNLEVREVNNKSTWNEFINNFPVSSNGVPKVTFIQSFQWGEFQKSLGKDIARFGVFEDGRLVGICAGTIIRARRGKYLYVRNGPILDWTDKELVEFLVNFLKDFAKKERLWFIRISPLVERSSKEEKVITSFKFTDCPMNDVEALDTWIMRLEGDEDEIFNRISKKTRYVIRQGLNKENLVARITTDPKDIDIFYEILNDTVSRHKWTSYSKSYIQKEFEAFSKDGLASMILVKHENTYIAGGIFIHLAGQSFYHYGASLTSHAKFAGMYVMIWEAIKQSIIKQNKFFNFWGISPENKPNHPWTGLTNFKKKFPGSEQRWMISKDIPVSSKYKLTHLFEKFDKWRKGY